MPDHKTVEVWLILILFDILVLPLSLSLTHTQSLFFFSKQSPKG